MQSNAKSEKGFQRWDMCFYRSIKKSEKGFEKLSLRSAVLHAHAYLAKKKTTVHEKSFGFPGFRFWKSKSGFPNRTHPGFSDRWKVVAFDRKLRYGAEPVIRRDTKMAAELKCVNGTRNSVRNVPTGKTGLPFRFSTFSGNFPVGRADETFSTYCRTEISGNFD